jgi:hypothetical protein
MAIRNSSAPTTRALVEGLAFMTYAPTMTKPKPKAEPAMDAVLKRMLAMPPDPKKAPKKAKKPAK